MFGRMVLSCPFCYSFRDILVFIQYTDCNDRSLEIVPMFSLYTYMHVCMYASVIVFPFLFIIGSSQFDI
jgi:hypothetical protein